MSAEDAKQRQEAEKKREKQWARLKRNVVLVVLVILLVATIVSSLFLFRARTAARAARQALTDSFFRTIGVLKDTIPTRDEREALWELAQLDPANAAVRDKLLNRWFETPEAFMRGDIRGGQGLQAATGLNLEYHRLAITGTEELGLRIVAALEKEKDYNRLSSLSNALAALTAKMEPQDAAQLARQGAPRIATALNDTPETDSYRLSSLGNALAALAARMEPQDAAQIARQGARHIAAALVNPEVGVFSDFLSLGNALAALAVLTAEMEPQDAAQIARRGALRIAAAFKKTPAVDFYGPRDLDLDSTLAALAAKMKPKDAAEFASQIAMRIAKALENTHETDSNGLRKLDSALATLVAKMKPLAAAEIAKGLIEALVNPQEMDSKRLSSLGRTLAAFCALLPSAHCTQLLALSNLLLTPMPKKAVEGEQQPYDRKLLKAVCAQLHHEELAEVLKYPFCTGDAEQIVLKQLNSETQRDFGGDVWKFVEQANLLGIKDIADPAKRPSAQDALNDLDKI